MKAQHVKGGEDSAGGYDFNCHCKNIFSRRGEGALRGQISKEKIKAFLTRISRITRIKGKNI